MLLFADCWPAFRARYAVLAIVSPSVVRSVVISQKLSKYSSIFTMERYML